MGRTEQIHAGGDTVREFAEKAYSDLDSSVPEFGDYTRTAIFDTAADSLTTAGFEFDHAELRAICARMA